jgi:hypothetical protein
MNRGVSIGQVAMKPINITRRKPTIVEFTKKKSTLTAAATSTAKQQQQQ